MDGPKFPTLSAESLAAMMNSAFKRVVGGLADSKVLSGHRERMRGKLKKAGEGHNAAANTTTQYVVDSNGSTTLGQRKPPRQKPKEKPETEDERLRQLFREVVAGEAEIAKVDSDDLRALKGSALNLALRLFPRGGPDEALPAELERLQKVYPKKVDIAFEETLVQGAAAEQRPLECLTFLLRTFHAERTAGPLRLPLLRMLSRLGVQGSPLKLLAARGVDPEKDVFA